MGLQLLDVFSKTSEDARVRTKSGGVVSVLVGLVLFYLVTLQLRAYNTFIWDHQLVLDAFRQRDMTITVDVSLPNLPCDMITVHGMNDAGEELILTDRLLLADLNAEGQPLDPEIKAQQTRERDEAIAARDLNTASQSCYAAADKLPEDQRACITCKDVLMAYARTGISVLDSAEFEQCRDEHYPEHLEANKNNGCRVQGSLLVSKVKGHLHFAPGTSFGDLTVHTHDTTQYMRMNMPFDMTHTINEFSFGDHTANIGQEDPLAGFTNRIDAPEARFFQYRYFIEVVGTDYQFAHKPPVSTNQYSVTHHERPIMGGRDEDHPNSAHSRGGSPGIWFTYDISPMKVVEMEIREQSLGLLLMNLFAIIGAVITTGAVVDRGVYVVDQVLQARKIR